MLFRTQNEIAASEKICIRRKTEEQSCGPHSHELVELCYVLAGGDTQRVGERVYEVAHGDLLFIDPGQTHEIVPHGSMTYAGHYDMVLIPVQFMG